MNNYCIHLKKRKNKPYCKIRNNQIAFSECKECKEKEYKTKIKQNSSYKKEKCTISSKKCAKMRFKSNKLAKFERNRFSVFTDTDYCFMCGSIYQLTWNEIYRGKNRINSMKYGFCLRMCLSCHRLYQDDVDFNEYWHRQAQLYWENNISTREEFLKVFWRNWLE